MRKTLFLTAMIAIGMPMQARAMDSGGVDCDQWLEARRPSLAITGMTRTELIIATWVQAEAVGFVVGVTVTLNRDLLARIGREDVLLAVDAGCRIDAKRNIHTVLVEWLATPRGSK